MGQDRISRLSEGQRQCLRMVYRHMETKEIARTLGISPDGVAQRIKTAMRILGVHRRRDAARLLAEAEGAAGAPSYPSQVNPPWDIASAPEPATIAALFEGERRHYGEPSGRGLREEQMAYEAAIPSPPGARLPLPVGGARPNDVGVLTRLAWIVGIVVGIAIAFGGLFAGVDAIVRLIVALNNQ
ncbi:MAG TPA: helix-turn-helix transcriptional regulator [Allosphingosinicella sp.]|nr:helix-turn-helix transcriptional regulator [Allosphingosinicella sp.]